MNVLVKNLGNGIKNVTINDPKTYNSLSFATLRSLLNTFRKLDKDNNTKVIFVCLDIPFHSVHRLQLEEESYCVVV